MSTREDRLMDVTDALRELENKLGRLHIADFEYSHQTDIMDFRDDIGWWHEKFADWEIQDCGEEVQES